MAVDAKTAADTGHNAHPDLINGSLVGVLSKLEQDKVFHQLAVGDIEVSDDVDNSILAGVPEGLRPALAAAIAQGVNGGAGKPVVLVVASGREAEETVGSLRSWYDGDPNDIAQLEAWETLPHERLSPRADTVASRMAVFRRLKHPSDANPMFGPIRILVMPIRSLIQPVVQGLGDVEPLVFTVGEDLPLDEAAKRLIENAYTRVELVMDRANSPCVVAFSTCSHLPRRTRCVSNSSVTKSTLSRNSTLPTSAPMARGSKPSGPPLAANCN